MLFITSGTGVAIFFKPMLDEFGWDRPTLSLASSVAALVFAAIAPFMGRFIDRFGGRAMLFIATATQTLSSLVIGLAPNLALIYIGRILGIIGYLHPATVLVNRWFVKKRGWALGIVSIGFPMGILVLSPVSQLLVLSWGWRQTLFFWAGVTVILILPLVVFLRNKPGDKGLLPDGEVASEIAHSESEPRARTETGVDLKQTLGTRSFWLLFFAMFICGTSCGLILTHTVIFGTDLGYSEIIAATFLSVQGGVCILGVTLTGSISDRFARNKVLGATFIVRSLSFVVLVVAVVAGGTSLWMFYLGMAFFGFGSFTTAPLSNGLAADLFGNRRMGTIIGILSGAHMIGSAIGTFAGGLTYQLTGNYLIILAVQALVELLAAVFAFLIKKPAKAKAASIIDSRAFQSNPS
jgi:MFS family permease